MSTGPIPLPSAENFAAVVCWVAFGVFALVTIGAGIWLASKVLAWIFRDF